MKIRAGKPCLGQIHIHHRIRRILTSAPFFILALFGVLSPRSASAAICSGCAEYAPAAEWAPRTSDALGDASGLAISIRNPGVLWTHNDGTDSRFFAFTTNGSLLARFDIDTTPEKDVEDMALGPGPVAGVTYLYAGDIGGLTNGGTRASVRILRVREPEVPLDWAWLPRATAFADVDKITLAYPDGSYDAEALFVDPRSGDLFIATKGDNVARLYRANLNSLADGGSGVLEYLGTVPFDAPSSAAISRDGSRILFRNEDEAMLWFRCPDETVATALARPGMIVPVLGTPFEPNGEGIAFLPDSGAYVTISDSIDSPPVHIFAPLCPSDITVSNLPPTQIIAPPMSAEVVLGGTHHLSVLAAGQNLRYQWLLNDLPLPGATNSVLFLTELQVAHGGTYSVVVRGDGGTVTSSPPAMVERQSPPPEPAILVPPASEVAPLRGWKTLRIFATGEPPLTYSWTRNGRALKSDGPSLTLKRVSRSSAGTYYVTVYNDYGVAEAAAEVWVMVPPKVRIAPRNRVARPGSTVVLRARARGDEPLQYQWSYNGEPIAGETGSELYLYGVDSSFSGQYSVTVSNDAGTDEATAKLFVR